MQNGQNVQNMKKYANIQKKQNMKICIIPKYVNCPKYAEYAKPNLPKP